MNTSMTLIERLSSSETFQNYERAYTEATGMPLVLRPVAIWRLPFQGVRNENRFCGVMAEKSRAPGGS